MGIKKFKILGEIFDDAFMLLHLFYSVVWFWFYLIWIWKFILNGFGKQIYKIKEKKKPYLCSRRPGSPPKPASFFLPRCWVTRARFSISSSCPRGPAQEPQPRAFLFLVSLTNRSHLSVASFFSVSWPSRRRVRSSPNQTQFSQDFDPSWGVPTPYKLEPLLYPSVLPGFRAVIFP
jgi:hypothetical protein